MRIFLDANVLFSAAKSAGAMRAMLELLLDSGHDCCVDAYVVEEARRNLAAKSSEALQALSGLLVRMQVAGAHPHRSADPAVLALPEKDRPVLEAAIRLRCDALVTGDRTHFGRLYGKTIEGVTIHSPRTLAVELLS
ncbi:MAG: PIN domain-containing protein [Steroidobacteraceae bacterium]|jgi:predicted nucleic acid-binding protein